jgi:hypothetical protein
MLCRQGHQGPQAGGSNETRARARSSRHHTEGRQADRLDKPRLLRPQAQRGRQVGHRLRGASRTEQPDPEADAPVPHGTRHRPSDPADGKVLCHRRLRPRLLSVRPGRGEQGPHNVHAAIWEVAIPSRTNGAISNLGRLVQEEQLCH